MTTKESVLQALLDCKDHLSGGELAEKLGVSRNAVWKSVKALQAEGFDIEAVPNRGYHLISSVSVLNETIIRKYLPKGDNRKIYIFDMIDSTNIYAKSIAAEGAKDGTLVTAEAQTAGKGRMGRSFCSPSGGSIYMSVILRPQTDLESSQIITSCIAVAVAEAIDSICSTDVKIKWVNDLFLGGKKICGILTEASLNFENGRLDYAVAGIGINLKSVKESFSDQLSEVATSIEDEIGRIPDRCRLIAEILKNIDLYMSNIDKRNFLDEYRRRSFIIGERVSVSKFDSERIASAIGISDNAGLIVRYDDGSQETLNSGEARIIRQR